MKKSQLMIALPVLFVIATAIANDHNLNHSPHTMHHSGHSGMNHAQHTTAVQPADSALPKEAGHDGFAAIAEIVRILSADPKTDWSKVNINALREHLLDMDRLVSGATVSEQTVKNGRRFHVTGQTEVLRAIQQMVPAHAAELAKMPGYTATTEPIEQGIALTVTGQHQAVIARIKGLGFFGLMATGSHHQAHHLMMATGQGHRMQH